MLSKTVVRKLLVVCGAVALFWAGFALGQNKFGTPSTLIHVVTIKWKAGVSDADKKKALDGVKEMAGQIQGIKNVWIKPTKVQPQEYNDVFVIEFENREALKRYADHPAHTEWSKHYLSVREESMNSVVTN